MWTNTIAFIMLLLSCFCNGKIEEKSKINTKQAIKCIYVSSNYQTIQKISNYFNIKFDEIEKQGIDFYFLLSSDNVEFSFYSLPKNIKFNLVQIESNIFFNPDRKIYFGIKEYENGKASVWLEKVQKNLFKQYEMIGSVINEDKDCLDRNRIQRGYEFRKAEIEAGPEPNHYVGIGQGFHTINKDSVLMRDFPSTQGKIIQKLKKGETVAVIAVETDYVEIEPYGKNYWVKIELLNKKRGYIFGAFVQWKEDFPPGYKIEE